VPAKAGGLWRSNEMTLSLHQTFQLLRGTLALGGKELEISEGRLRGRALSFVAGGLRYEGEVEGDTISGTADGKPWTAKRLRTN
jgi:hypothetical protein